MSDGPDPNCRYCQGTGIIREKDKMPRPCICDIDPPDDGLTTRQRYRKHNVVSVFSIPWPSKEAPPHG